MDTREKLVSLDRLPALLREQEWVAVVGLFDPLTAVQAERLHALSGGNKRILAIVVESERALLSVEARAALMASLRCVSSVAISDAETWRRYVADVQIVEDEAGEKARSTEFVRFVLDRQ